MTEPSPAESIAEEQAQLNAAQPLVLASTAEQRFQAATDTERRQTEAPALPAMPMRRTPERILGAAVLLAVVGAFLVLTQRGRLEELHAHAVLVLPFSLTALAFGALLCLPIPIAAELVGLHKPNGERIRRRRSYALIIPKGSTDGVLVPITAPAFRAMTPPGIYEVRSTARVRIPKWIPAGTYLTVYNQSNPEPVNDQSIHGFTSEHVHQMTAGPTLNLVTAAWAAAMRFVGLDRRKLLYFAIGIALLYFGYQWYTHRYPDGGFLGGLF